MDLWELVILPTLMYNSEMLVNIPKVAEETLEDLHFFFVRLILRVPYGTPKVSLLSETGLLSIRLRLWKRKCLMIHHIKNMEKEKLAKQIYLEQIENGWPDLSKELTLICEELGIEDVNFL